MAVNVIFRQNTLLSNSPCSKRVEIWVQFATTIQACWDHLQGYSSEDGALQHVLFQTAIIVLTKKGT